MQKQGQSAATATALIPFLPSFLQKPLAGWILAAVFAVVMVAVNLSYHRIGDYNVETDFYWSYAPEAKRVLSGSLPIDDFRGPGYPVALAAVNLLLSDLFVSGIVLATLSAGVVLALMFLLLQRLFRTDIAVVVVLLTAVNTHFVRYTYTVGTDMLFNALVCASIFFFLKDAQRVWMSIVLSAVFAGLAYLTRYNGIFVLGAVPLVVLVVNLFQLSWVDRLKTCGVFLAVFVLVIAPWGIHSLQERGSFFYNKNYLNIAYEMFAKDRIAWDQFWSIEAKRYTSLTHVIFADVGLFIKTLLTNIVTHAANDLMKLVGTYTGIFSLAGGATLFRKGVDRRVVSFFLVAAGFFAVLLLVFYGERFSLFLLPAYLVLALIALSEPRIARITMFKRIPVVKAIVPALVLWTAADSWSFNRTNIDSGPVEVLSIAEAFKKSGESPPPESVVVTRKPHIAYYLNMRMELFPLVNSFEELQSEVRRAKGSYLYFSWVEARARPQFESLLDLRKPLPWLKPVAYTSLPPAVLFKVELAKE